MTGDTPLHLAIVSKNKELVEILLDANADINLRNNRERSGLDLLQKYYSLHTEKYLDLIQVTF